MTQIIQNHRDIGDQGTSSLIILHLLAARLALAGAKSWHSILLFFLAVHPVKGENEDALAQNTDDWASPQAFC